MTDSSDSTYKKEDKVILEESLHLLNNKILNNIETDEFEKLEEFFLFITKKIPSINIITIMIPIKEINRISIVHREFFNIIKPQNEEYNLLLAESSLWDHETIQDIIENENSTYRHDVGYNITYRPIFDYTNTKSELCIPIVVRKNLISIINFESLTNNAWSLNQCNLLKELLFECVNILYILFLEKKIDQYKSESMGKSLSIKSLSDFQNQLLNSLNDSVITENRLGIVNINSSAENLLGYTIDDLKKLPLRTLFAPESLNIIDNDPNTINGHPIGNFRLNLINKSGKRVPVLLNSSEITYRNMKRGYITLISDLSHVLSIEDEILELRDYNNAVLKHLPVGIVTTDNNFVVQNINPSFERILNIIGPDHLNKSINSLLEAIFQEETIVSTVFEIIEKVADNKDFTLDEVPLEINGKPKFITFLGEPLYEVDGINLIGMEMIAIDRTSTVQLLMQVEATRFDLEEQKDYYIQEKSQRSLFQRELLLRSKKLELRTKETENLMFSLSHDLKNPVVSVQGYLNFILEEFEDQLSEEIQDYFNRIIVNAETIGNRVLILADYSKIGIVESDSPKEEDLFSIIESAIILESEIIDEDEKFRIVFKDKHWPLIICVRSQILNAFREIIKNAFRFRKKDIDDRWLEIKSVYAEDDIKISFTDNGVGIDPKSHKKVFTLFSRLNNEEFPFKSKETGQGVGMAFAKKYIEVNSGEIEIGTTKEGYTVFIVTLPGT